MAGGYGRRRDMRASARVEQTLFTPGGLASLLQEARAAGYAFLGFDESADDASAERICLLRHDVDADPEAAALVARVEAELGIRATYFFMLRSPLYNVLGRENSRLVREVLALGHDLGLHFDVCFDDGSGRTLEESVELERRVLSDAFETPVRALSFHQVALRREPPSLEFAGLVNANDPGQLPGFEYISDSNKSARVALLGEAFREARYPRLQLLLHPLWWISDDASASAESLWDQAIERNWNRSQRQLLEAENAYGAERVFRIDPVPED